MTATPAETRAACPGTNTLATREEILAGCEVYYGVPLAEIGEQGEAVLAIGHHEPRRVLAALLAFARSRRWPPSEVGLAVTEPAEAEEAKQWHLFYRHADAKAAGNHWAESGWCVCHDCTWWAANASEDTPGATPVMWWVLS